MTPSKPLVLAAAAAVMAALTLAPIEAGAVPLKATKAPVACGTGLKSATKTVKGKTISACVIDKTKLKKLACKPPTTSVAVKRINKATHVASAVNVCKVVRKKAAPKCLAGYTLVTTTNPKTGKAVKTCKIGKPAAPAPKTPGH